MPTGNKRDWDATMMTEVGAGGKGGVPFLAKGLETTQRKRIHTLRDEFRIPPGTSGLGQGRFPMSQNKEEKTPYTQGRG